MIVMAYIVEWKPVLGFEGLYEVSKYGEVRSLITGKILSKCISQGYYYVALFKDGKRYNKQVHRLVAEAFLFNDNNYPIVNHKNEIKTSNEYNNLEWCTYSYNNTYNNIHIKRGNKLKGREAHNKGKTDYMSSEARDKIREYRTGTRLSDETKNKISKSLQQYYNK